MRSFTPLPILLAFLLSLLSPSALAQTERPLWEAGLGVTALSFPDYRGSDHQRGYLLPLPYLIYRGQVFRADRDGVSPRRSRPGAPPSPRGVRTVSWVTPC